MGITMRLAPASIAGLLLLLIAACGGGDSSGDPASLEYDGGSDLLVSNAVEALGRSAEHFQQEVESVRAEFSFNTSASDGDFGADGSFMFESPDKMYLAVELEAPEGEGLGLDMLGSIELLVLGDEFYANTPLTGWVVMTAEDLGEWAQMAEDMQDAHSPFDYQSLVESLGDYVENLGEETIDGHTYTHLRVTVDVADMMADLMSSFGDTGFGDMDGFTGAPLGDFFTKPIEIDIWLDPETLLPYLFQASMSVGFGAETVDVTMEIKFLDYNEPLDFPAAPEDAIPITDVLGDLTDILGEDSPFGSGQ